MHRIHVHHTVWEHLRPRLEADEIGHEVLSDSGTVRVVRVDTEPDAVAPLIEQAEADCPTAMREAHWEMWERSGQRALAASGLPVEVTQVSRSYYELLFDKAHAEAVDALLAQAEADTPVTMYLSALQWELLEPRLEGVEVVSAVARPRQSGHIEVEVEVPRTLTRAFSEQLRALDPEIKARQPDLPMWIVRFDLRESHYDGTFVVATATAGEAEALIATRYPAYEVTSVESLADWEGDRDPLQPHHCPIALGHWELLDLGS